MLDLVQQLQARTVKREYWALTRGKAPADKVIEAAIERDPRNPRALRSVKAEEPNRRPRIFATLIRKKSKANLSLGLPAD